jgi:hypothetical protein
MWVPFSNKGNYESEDDLDEVTDVSERVQAFNAIWALNQNQILRRKCDDCASTHQDIYYCSFDTDGLLPDGFDMLDKMNVNWNTVDQNNFNVDFKLYSTYEDALRDENQWLFCNFSNNIGFPRDCWPTLEDRGGNQWNLSVVGRGQQNVGFYVETLPYQ